MSRKHFIEIAKTLKENQASLELIKELCFTFKRINPRFDRQRFISACGH